MRMEISATSCEESWIFMTRAEHARAHGFGGAR